MSLTDLELVKKIKEESCDESLKELIVRHTQLYLKICHNYEQNLIGYGVTHQDLLNEKDHLFYRAACSFSLDKKVQFNTWLGLYTGYFCKTVLSQNERYYKIKGFSKKEQILSSQECKWPEYGSKTSFDGIIEKIDKLGCPVTSQIFKTRYLADRKPLTFKKISEKLEIPLSRVRNLHRKGILNLKKQIKLENI